MTLEDAVDRTVKRTRNLARRQMAWFRRDPRIRWFAVGEEGAVEAVDAIRAYLEGSRVSEIAFAKYEAAGNDFIVIEDLEDAGPLSAEDVRALCDRWTGVGADGVIRLTRTAQGRFGFHLANADGTPAAMSGNGMRCLGAYIHDRKLTDEAAFDVATTAGLRHVALAPAGRARARGHGGHGHAGLHQGPDPDVRGRVGDVPRAALRPRQRPHGDRERRVDGEPPPRPVPRRGSGALPRGAHRARARASRVVPGTHQRGVRARARRRDRRARLGARGGGDPRLRHGRVRGGRRGTARRSGYRTRSTSASAGAPCGSPAPPTARSSSAVPSPTSSTAPWTPRRCDRRGVSDAPRRAHARPRGPCLGERRRGCRPVRHRRARCPRTGTSSWTTATRSCSTSPRCVARASVRGARRPRGHGADRRERARRSRGSRHRGAGCRRHEGGARGDARGGGRARPAAPGERPRRGSPVLRARRAAHRGERPVARLRPLPPVTHDRPRAGHGAHRQRDPGRVPREPRRPGDGARGGGAQRPSVARGERDPRPRSVRWPRSPIFRSATWRSTVSSSER